VSEGTVFPSLYFHGNRHTGVCVHSINHGYSTNLQSYIPTRLHGLVDMIWEQKSDLATRWAIAPTGRIELLFRLGEEPELLRTKRIDVRERPLKDFCFMSGLHTGPLAMGFDSFHMMGVQMHPVAFNAFFRMPLNEIRDYYMPGVHILHGLSEIEEKLKGDGSFRERAEWLEQALLARIHETPELHAAIALGNTMREIAVRHRPVAERDIESMLGYSRTHCFRLFNTWFGLPPHGVRKLQQFVAAVRTLHASSASLTMIALNLGYYDQAHFIRSFKSYAGITPGEYRGRMTAIPGQFPF
jgi:AraC-like DNA-binding protein